MPNTRRRQDTSARPIDDRIVSEKEAARIRGVSEYTLRRQAERGEGPERIRLSPRRIGYRISDLLSSNSK
jgi:hypothetical protein